MNDKQRLALMRFIGDWHEKLGIGCFLVGMFQDEHILGGMIGGVICFLVALYCKIRSAK